MARRRRGQSKRALWIVLLLAAAAAAYFLLLRGEDTPKDSRNQPVPVVVAPAALRDVPVFLHGIGTVISPHQVVVRSRVDGELMKVYFTEGQEVKAGQLLAEIDPRAIQATLAQAKADRARTEAQWRAAELDEQRYQNLLKDDAIARQQVDQQTALVAQLKAAVAAADAMIVAAEVQLGYTRITSPVSGRVGIRQVDPGNIVRSSDANGLLTVTQMHPIQVLFTLPQEALTQLQAIDADQKAQVDAWTKEGGEKLATGYLEVVDNLVDPSSGTVRLKARFENKDYKLWPGQFVVARLKAETLEQKVCVPVRAVQRGRDGNFVWRIQNEKAEAVPVTILHEDDDWAVVEKSIAEGDQLVVDGQMRLKPEATVTVQSNDAGAKNAAPAAVDE